MNDDVCVGGIAAAAPPPFKPGCPLCEPSPSHTILV